MLVGFNHKQYFDTMIRMNEDRDPTQDVNEYLPPEPAPASPQQQVMAARAVREQQTTQPTKQDATDVMAAKKKQGTLFLAISGVLALLLIGGIGFLLISLGSNNDSETASNLTTDEQLEFDANRLGLAIINYSAGRQPFEITPAATNELSVVYLSNNFDDPRTNQPYALTTAIPAVGEMQYIVGGVCNTDDSISQGTATDGFAIRVLLETEQLYCVERSEIRQPN